MKDQVLKEVAERAASKGATLLDEKRPHWEEEIDRDRLDIKSFVDCMATQLYGGFARGIKAIFGVEDDNYRIDLDHKIGEYGFGMSLEGLEFVPNNPTTVRHDQIEKYFRYLDEAWRKEIDIRRFKGEISSPMLITESRELALA